MKVAVTCIQLIRDLDQHRPVLEGAGLSVTVPVIAGQHLEGDELVAAVEGCVGVIAGDDRFTAEVLDRCDDLRVISKWGIGIDGIDLAAAAARGIVVTNTPGVFDDEVADVTMAYLVDARSRPARHRPRRACRRVAEAGRDLAARSDVGDRRARRHRPRRGRARRGGGDDRVRGGSLARVGRAATAIGVSVLPFADLLAASDFVSVNCPLTAETFHLFDVQAFAAMKPGAYLVNTGRGGVVATDALIGALTIWDARRGRPRRDGTRAAHARTARCSVVTTSSSARTTPRTPCRRPHGCT